MNILMIGNGFDLEHDLPTKYIDFLEFVEKFICAYSLVKENPNALGTIEDEYLKLIFERPEYKNRVNALYIFTNNNIWIRHFNVVYKEHLANRENWVDFESEISDVIQSIDGLLKYYISIEKGENENKTLESFYRKKLQNIGNLFSIKSITKKIPELLLDLNKLIGALEIYMWDYIGSKGIQYYNPDIAQICPNRVLSFNYSDTYRILYAYNQKNIDYSYIHGKAENNISFFVAGAEATKEEIDSWIQKNADLNNMVLGIDEYLEKERTSKETDFIAFKKYYQRIYKETGCKYKEWIYKIRESGKSIEEKLRAEYSIQIPFLKFPNDARHNLYIYGHSLDITDRDILSELILNDNVYTTIFYYNRADLGSKIANLVKVIGQDELIRRTGGSTKTIEFKLQQDMVEI